MNSERVNATTHERADGLVHQTVPRELRAPTEVFGHNAHTKVPALACARMTYVGAALIHHLHLGGGEPLLESTADIRDHCSASEA